MITPDLYDPKLNRAYAEMAEHYGVLIDPARASKPKDKPRVERQMPFVRDSMWRGRSFVGMADMQAEALRWCAHVAGARSHRSLQGAALCTPGGPVSRRSAGTSCSFENSMASVHFAGKRLRSGPLGLRPLHDGVAEFARIPSDISQYSGEFCSRDRPKQ